MRADIKSPKDIEHMRVACRMAAETLMLVGEQLRIGMTTDEINTIVHEDTIRRNAYPAPLNYHGFPKSVCTSVNDVVCHGIPDGTILRDGDIVNVDVTTFYQGYYGDTSATFYIGTPSAEAIKVTEIARRSLDLGIAEVKDGAKLGNIGAAIQTYAESMGCGVVRGYVGHGIGRRFHEPPQVKHYGKRNTGDAIRAGMIFTIEPMINAGSHETVTDAADKWTVRTRDKRISAQFEHTLLVTRQGVEVLTARPGPLKLSEGVTELYV